MDIALIALGGILLLALIWLIATYNRFVRLRHHIKESWADIDVELKRRSELIPNLVETVKGFAKHEREVLERVVQLRNKAMANSGSAASQRRCGGPGRIFTRSRSWWTAETPISSSASTNSSRSRGAASGSSS